MKDARQQADLIRRLGKHAVVPPQDRLALLKKAMAKQLGAMQGSVAKTFGLKLINPKVEPEKVGYGKEDMRAGAMRKDSSVWWGARQQRCRGLQQAAGSVGRGTVERRWVGELTASSPAECFFPGCLASPCMMSAANGPSFSCRPSPATPA